jgi:hypothetical protein
MRGKILRSRSTQRVLSQVLELQTGLRFKLQRFPEGRRRDVVLRGIVTCLSIFIASQFIFLAISIIISVWLASFLSVVHKLYIKETPPLRRDSAACWLQQCCDISSPSAVTPAMRPVSCNESETLCLSPGNTYSKFRPRMFWSALLQFVSQSIGEIWKCMEPNSEVRSLNLCPQSVSRSRFLRVSIFPRRRKLLTSVLIKCMVFWKVTPCSLVYSYHRFVRNCCLLAQPEIHLQYGGSRFVRNHDIRVLNFTVSLPKRP